MHKVDYFREKYPQIFLLSEQQASIITSGTIQSKDIRDFIVLKIDLILGINRLDIRSIIEKELEIFLSDIYFDFK